MVFKAYNTFTLYTALRDEGFDLPEGCGDLRLEIPVDGCMHLHYEELLTGDRLAKFTRALAKVASEGQE